MVFIVQADGARQIIPGLGRWRIGEEPEGGEAGTGRASTGEVGRELRPPRALGALRCEDLPQRRGVPAVGGLLRSGGGDDLDTTGKEVDDPVGP